MGHQCSSLLSTMYNEENPSNIINCINNADEKAKVFIGKSSFIKSKHEAGCINTSLESTIEGSLRGADTFAGSMLWATEPKETFFGEHACEAIQIIKDFMKKR